MVSSIEEIKNCPTCGSDNLVHISSRDQIVCRDCGVVHEPFSSVSKEVLEIIKPSEEESTGVAVEKITLKPLKPTKVKKPKKKKLKKKLKKRVKKKKKIKKKAKKKIKKKKKPKKKVKKKPKKKILKKKVKPKKKPSKKPKKGLKARLKKLVRRKKR